MIMNRIATLGPPGTFSEKAANTYIRNFNKEWSIELFGSIKRVLKSIGKDCEYGVLPIENLSEGFISPVLDHLVDSNLVIVDEMLLPVSFSFVGNVSDIKHLKKLFVQFVSKGQCSEFVESLDNIEIVTTESNIESLEMASNESGACGAIVPSDSFRRSDFLLVRNNVHDFMNNQTRFVVLSDNRFTTKTQGTDYKTSIVALDDNDRPGLLQSILLPFSKRGINLTSIVSRPSRQFFGRYHFFIDLEGHENDGGVRDALGEIHAINRIKVLGSFPRAELI
jgi:prephenate dehydratase